MWKPVIRFVRHVAGNLVIGIGDAILPHDEQFRNTAWPLSDYDRKAALDR